MHASVKHRKKGMLVEDQARDVYECQHERERRLRMVNTSEVGRYMIL